MRDARVVGLELIESDDEDLLAKGRAAIVNATVGSLLDDEGKLAILPTAARIVHGVAAALVEAHRAGVLHRDLNGRHVIVQPDGTPSKRKFPRRSVTARFGVPGTETDALGTGVPVFSSRTVPSMEPTFAAGFAFPSGFAAVFASGFSAVAGDFFTSLLGAASFAFSSPFAFASVLALASGLKCLAT